METEAVGTFACPICGFDKPHHHDEVQVAAYHADQIRNDGWTSDEHRHPENSGWYLCLGVRINPNQDGEKKDFWAPHPLWSQLSWFLWVRDGGRCGYMGGDIPEVLYFDKHNGWYLRNLLGNAIASGEESRKRVLAEVSLWRKVEAPNKEALRAITESKVRSPE